MPQPVTARGPLVWRDMDQKTLDDAYDQDVYAPNRPLIVARRIDAAMNRRLPAALRIETSALRSCG